MLFETYAISFLYIVVLRMKIDSAIIIYYAHYRYKTLLTCTMFVTLYYRQIVEGTIINFEFQILFCLVFIIISHFRITNSICRLSNFFIRCLFHDEYEIFKLDLLL